MIYKVKNGSTQMSEHRLITHSGDMGDIDGFYGLAQYAKTGADVLFILNYPAYFNVRYTEPEKMHEHGLGYTYSVNSLLRMTRARFSDTDQYQVYNEVLQQFGLVDLNQDVTFKFKQMYTLLALLMCHEVWDGCPRVITSGDKETIKGQFHFCVGGVNSIDPFDIHEVNNEVFLFAEILKLAKVEANPNISNGVLMESDGSTLGYSLQFLLSRFPEIYMDFNGSMAFLTPEWELLIEKACKENRVKGAFIQGGVYSYMRTNTVPKREGVINRLSCATMNQLYSPQKSASFLELMKANNVTMFVVANNDIESLQDYSLFFETNKINYTPLVKYASIFYSSRQQVRVKPYDFYVALVVSMAIEDEGSLFNKSMGHKLFYDSTYAAALISKAATDGENAVIEYMINNDAANIDDIDKLRIGDKLMLRVEFKILINCSSWATYNVRTFSFKLDESTLLLTIKPPP